MNRYISLFTKVIWCHPDASKYVVYSILRQCLFRCKEVPRCRTRAIEYLSLMSAIRDRMRTVWSKSQTNSETVSVKSESSQPTPTPVPSIPDGQISRSTPSRSNTPTPAAKRQHSMSPVISLPFDLPSAFSRMAKPNTNRGIETCGVLLGYPQLDSFLVTTIVIPEQTGTANTCEALSEEETLSYALTNELVCLGWIHTHPTQSCFLSSIDMHTTLSYQRMLPGAISIVIAPADRNLPVGVWRLTPFGIDKVSQCKLDGFHDHDGKEAFSVLVDDVLWDPSLEVVIVDHRRV